MGSPIWKYCSSIYLGKKHCTLYRDDDLGVQLQVMMKRNGNFIAPRARCLYFIDGVDQAFKSKVALVHALEIQIVKKMVQSMSTDRKKQVSV